MREIILGQNSQEYRDDPASLIKYVSNPDDFVFISPVDEHIGDDEVLEAVKGWGQQIVTFEIIGEPEVFWDAYGPGNHAASVVVQTHVEKPLLGLTADGPATFRYYLTFDSDLKLKKVGSPGRRNSDWTRVPVHDYHA